MLFDYEDEGYDEDESRKTKTPTLMNSKKVNSSVLPSFRRKPESSKFNELWMPDQVRHDESRTFYEFINLKARDS